MTAKREVCWSLICLSGGIAVLLLLFSAPVPRPAALPAPARPSLPAARVVQRPRTPARAKLLEANRLWRQAVQATWPDLYAMDAADLSVPAETARCQALMARDRGGYLVRAREAARCARALARGRAEKWEAINWLTRIDCDLGRHGEELAAARQLVALKPKDPLSFLALRRAARCNARGGLALAAEERLDQLQQPHLPHAPPRF